MINGRAIDIHVMLLGGVLNIMSMQAITAGALAKTYSHLSGLHADPVVAKIYRWFTFERACIITAGVFLIGLAIILAVVTRWILSSFGDLNQPRLLFLGIIFLVNSIQLGTTFYLLSIMVLPRQAEPQRMSEGNRHSD